MTSRFLQWEVCAATHDQSKVRPKNAAQLTVFEKIKTILKENKMEYQVQGMDAWHNNLFMAKNVARDFMGEELGKMNKINFQVERD